MSIFCRTIAFLLLWSLTAGQGAFAQVGAGSTLWSWTISAAHHDAIVNVMVDGGSGTGIIIGVDRDKPVADGYQGYCLTAFHVVEADNNRREIKVRYRNGRGAQRCKVVKSDPEFDVAILWVWVPATVTPAPIAASVAQFGDALEFAGLGGATHLDHLRFFSAQASAPTNGNVIYCDVSLLPGDSGGPVFNDQSEVVGVISGGWFWWDGGILTDSGVPISTTWPARAANQQVIRRLADELTPTVKH